MLRDGCVVVCCTLLYHPHYACYGRSTPRWAYTDLSYGLHDGVQMAFSKRLLDALLFPDGHTAV